MAFGMFSVLPGFGKMWSEDGQSRMIAFYPAVGIAAGGLWYGAAAGIPWEKAPLLLAGAFLTVIPFAFSGFLHADGFADALDAVCSGKDREKRLKILKDPRIGTFGTVGLILLMLFSFCAVTALLEKQIAAGAAGTESPAPAVFFFIPVLSRSTVGAMVYFCKPLPESSYMKLFTLGARRRYGWIPAAAGVCALVWGAQTGGGSPPPAAGGSSGGGAPSDPGSFPQSWGNFRRYLRMRAGIGGTGRSFGGGPDVGGAGSRFELKQDGKRFQRRLCCGGCRKDTAGAGRICTERNP